MNRSQFAKGEPRRNFLRKGLCGLGVPLSLPVVLQRASSALAADVLDGKHTSDAERILVVVELTGGNDGLNTVVPYGDDEYYRVRPRIGVRKQDAIAITDAAGFHPSLAGFERLYRDGKMAVVEGCGYSSPSLSHFSSMSFWHTGVPNGGETLGWIGRFADASTPAAVKNAVVNIASSQSLAVRGKAHPPLVFDDPAQLRRIGSEVEKQSIGVFDMAGQSTNESLGFLRSVARNASESGALVRDAWSSNSTPVDYGIAGGLSSDLRKVAALIAAGLPTRVYYVAYRGNSFDTHVQQADLHSRLLMYTADAVRGFMDDVSRIGRGADVSMMIFTEFGRRIEENASAGTDHGTAGPMFVFGQDLNGGFYGTAPSLTDTDAGNLKMTTDFRRVYATMIAEWMGHQDTSAILRGEFEPLGIFT